MALPTPRVTQAMLERAVGGADKLLELADRNRTGNINDAVCQAFIVEIIADGCAEVNGYISPAVDLNDPALQTAPLLIRYETAVDVYLAWLRGANGIAVPERVQAEYDRVLSELTKIAERRKGIGLLTRPVSAQPVQQVTKPDADDFFSPVGPRRRFDGWS